MKNLKAAPFALLLTLSVLLGCKSLTSSTTANTASRGSNADTAASSEKPAKAVDMPALVGKSFAEIEAQLGPPADKTAGMPKWTFPAGDLTVWADYRDKKKVGYMTFTMKMVTAGNSVARGFAKYEQLGDVVGIDVRGKTPTKTPEGDTDSVEFENFDLNGKTAPLVKFNKVSDIYDAAWIYVEKP